MNSYRLTKLLKSFDSFKANKDNKAVVVVRKKRRTNNQALTDEILLDVELRDKGTSRAIQ